MIERSALTFSEVIVESVDSRNPPRALMAARERGLVVIPHGTRLSLGSAARPDRERVKRIAELARTLRAPLVSEHVALSRSGELSSPHFLPVPRTRAQLALLVDHVRYVMDQMPVPLALENVAMPFAWPEDEYSDADFMRELCARTGALLLLDVANIHVNVENHGIEPMLDRYPLDRVAYLHVAGGARVRTLWRDTHAHSIAPATLELVREVLRRTGPRPVLLERDEHFDRGGLERELAVLRGVLTSTPQVELPHAPRVTTPLDQTPLARPPLDRSPLTRLAARHEELLAALLHGTSVPLGFDPVQLDETRAILRGKHR
jgi:uncharacterized protein